MSSDGDASGGAEVGNIGFYHRNFMMLVCRALLAPQEGKAFQLPFPLPKALPHKQGPDELRTRSTNPMQKQPWTLSLSWWFLLMGRGNGDSLSIPRGTPDHP